MAGKKTTDNYIREQKRRVTLWVADLKFSRLIPFPLTNCLLWYLLLLIDYSFDDSSFCVLNRNVTRSQTSVKCSDFWGELFDIYRQSKRFNKLNTEWVDRALKRSWECTRAIQKIKSPKIGNYLIKRKY